MKHLNNNHGFSLLEVVIALAIFSISIVALYTIQTRTIGQNYTASRITTSVNWSSEWIENLIALSYEDVIDKSPKDGVAGLKAIDSAGGYIDPAKADGSATSPDGVYTVMWKVAEEWPLPNTKTVRMIVTSQRAGTGRLVDLEYIKHKAN